MGLAPMVVSWAASPWVDLTLQAHIAERPEAEQVAVGSVHHMVMRTCGTVGMLVVPVPMLVVANPPVVFALAGLALVAAASASIASSLPLRALV